MMQDRAMIAMKGKQETPIFRMVQVWMILSDL